MSGEVNPTSESQNCHPRSPMQPHPSPKPHPPETHRLPQPNLDPEVNSAEDDDDDDDEGQHASASEVTIASVTAVANARRGAAKPKKGRWKGKGKGKSHVKKQQAIEEKLRRLVEDLNPIPFAPTKILDFSRHEALLKKLGLWDLVQVDFDKEIRADLIAQLVASYEAKPRASYVNDLRIRVNRADLARAMRLPLKRGNGGVDGVDVDLDPEVFSNESIRFMEDFLLEWVLLHDDIWMMPNEVREWIKTVEDGHPEKVDWAAVFWFMVEKELTQGGNLKNCHYASHMQHLIKSQREELFQSKDRAPTVETIVELDNEEDSNDMASTVETIVDFDAKAKEKGDGVNEEGTKDMAPAVETIDDLDAEAKEKGGKVNQEGAKDMAPAVEAIVDLDAEAKEKGGEVNEEAIKDMVPTVETLVDLDAEAKEKGNAVNEEGTKDMASAVETVVDLDAEAKEKGNAVNVESTKDMALAVETLVDWDAEAKEKGNAVNEESTKDMALAVETLVDWDAEAKEKGDGVNEEGTKACASMDIHEEENHEMVLSTELTLGQDGEKEDGRKDVNMRDDENCRASENEDARKDVNMRVVENCKGSDWEGEVEEKGQWLLDGRNKLGQHFMQPCDAGNDEEFWGIEDRKEEADEEGEEEEEEMDGDDDDEEELGSRYHVFSNDNALERDVFTGNLLQAMEGNTMVFDTEEHFHCPHSADVRADIQHMNSTHSLFNSSGKRVIEHDNHGSRQALNESNKRLRINESWDHKPVDFGMCLEQIQQWSERARGLYEEKEHALDQANMTQQILLSEVQKRDNMIEHLRKFRLDEVQKKDGDIYRLERELYLMRSVLDGYRKSLKGTQKAFAEYREKAQLPEESTYKDTGSGGLMLSAAEIEKLEKRREEEYKTNCLILEQKMRETEEGYRSQFEGHVDKINLLKKKLITLEADAKKLIELYESRKIQQTGEEVPEHAETSLISQAEENGTEVAEPLPDPVNEEKLPEVANQPLIPDAEETTAEVEETRLEE